MMRGWASLVLTLTAVVALSQRGAAAAEDPRLGAPFRRRERAVLGPATARVVVIEFSSFRCAHCQLFHQEVFPSLRQRYVDTGQVQWVIIHASNDVADRESPVFLAARGALQQGSYWAVVDRLYQAARRSPDFLVELMTNTRRGGGGLETSLRDPAVRAAVAADFSEYAALGLRGTPTFLLRKMHADGRWTGAILEDSQPLDYFERVLDDLLQRP